MRPEPFTFLKDGCLLSYAQDAVAVEQFAWIPEKMFTSYCQNENPVTR